MIVSKANPPITIDSSYIDYGLEGGAVVCDKTNGIGKVIFEDGCISEKNKSTYQVFINDKKIIRPTCSNPSSKECIIFRNSLKFSFKWKDGFIKITEKDAQSKTIFYVDPKKDVDGIAYDAYSYIPKEISLEDAKQKIQNIKADFPDFTGDIAIYNRHGVAVFGWDKNIKNYALYWANPYEEKVKPMTTSECQRFRDGGTSFAKSTDGNVNFRYSHGKGSFLNAEAAVRIDLTYENVTFEEKSKKLDGKLQGLMEKFGI